MNSRYILNTASLVAGVVLLVASRVFTGQTLEWLAFGVSGAVLVAAVAGIATAVAGRHLARFGVLGAVAAWSAVVALVFTGSSLAWLVFADAIALTVIALGALVLHEVTTERVVHTLEVRDEIRESGYESGYEPVTAR